MNITYREATITDAPEITGLSFQFGYPADPIEVSKRLDNLLNKIDNIVYVAAMDHKLVGWVHAHGRHLLESPSFAEIGGLVVDQEARGWNIGKHLVRLCEEWAKRAGYEEIRVRSRTDREEAHHFYRRIGYENTKSQHVYKRKL